MRRALIVGLAAGGTMGAVLVVNHYHPFAAKGQGAGTPPGGLSFPYGVPGGWLGVVGLLGASTVLAVVATRR